MVVGNRSWLTKNPRLGGGNPPEDAFNLMAWRGEQHEWLAFLGMERARPCAVMKQFKSSNANTII